MTAQERTLFYFQYIEMAFNNCLKSYMLDLIKPKSWVSMEDIIKENKDITVFKIKEK